MAHPVRRSLPAPLRPARILLTALMIAGLALAGLVARPTAARAASDVVKALDVAMDIRPDGSIKVTQTYDYEFASRQSHGIQVKLVTREPWPDDESKDVVYGIDDVTVTSPTGAATDLLQSAPQTGRHRTLTLRIGNPDTEVGQRRHTYVISYTLTGALRTFDDAPQLFWDITSRENPPIEKISTTVTAPGPVTNSRCLYGGGECPTSHTGNRATFAASDLPSGTTFTIVAGLTPGSVANAQPDLQDESLISPRLTTLDASGTVDEHGTLTVEQTMTYTMPDDGDGTWTQLLATRRPWSPINDVEPTYRDLEVTIDGTPVDWSWRSGRRTSSLQLRALTASFPDMPGVRTRTVVLRYTAEGLTRPLDDGTVTTAWVIGSELDNLTSGRARLTLPAPAVEATCTVRYAGIGSSYPCRRTTPTTSGTTVTADLDEDSSSAAVELAASLPSSAVTLAPPDLQPSIDRRHGQADDLRTWGGVGGGALMLALGLALGQRGRSQRYRDQPPGVVTPGAAIVTARGHREVPVRFEPPDELTLLEAGVLDRGRYHPTQLAATLVEQAVRGHLRLSSRPLAVERWGEEPPEPGLGSRLWQLATEPGSSYPQSHPLASRPRELPDKTAVQLVSETRSRAEAVVRRGDLIRKTSPGPRGWLIVSVIAAAWLGWGFWLRPVFGWSTVLVPVVITLALPIGRIIGRAVSRPALTARGTALKEQSDGFKLYLSTAEADQLNVEADRDIFRRYLPWAVLFGLTERWTKVCRELASAGRIDTPDVTFLSLTDPGALPGAISSLTSSVQSASTSSSGGGWDGGSGSSSGFSSSSSSGGGGGGSSVSSW